METEEQIKKFTESFFSNLKCKVELNNGALTISSVPKDFEDFSGKKAPYYLVFNRAYQQENSELLTKGSQFLKSMMQYLNNLGQTTLLKISFDVNWEDEIQKHINLKNCIISSIVKDHKHKSFIRFTFLTTFQYLNEKEQIMSSFLVQDGNLVNLDLAGYSLVEGKKDDVQIKNIEKDYVNAKEALKDIIKPKIQQTTEHLNLLLEKEIARVKEHYNKQEKEVDHVISRNLSQLKELEKQISKAAPADQTIIESKIKKLKENVEILQSPARTDSIKKEETFFINDENHKHSLNVDNKLINTSIIYYPSFDFKMFLKNSNATRLLEIEFDPVYKNISKLKCEVCSCGLSEVVLCSAGHVVCSSCMSNCEDCQKESCKSCLNKKCDTCGRKLCRKCNVKCLSCGKYQCKTHMKKDPMSQKECCITCQKRCQSCDSLVHPSSIKRGVCEVCTRKEIAKKTLSGIFRS